MKSSIAVLLCLALAGCSPSSVILTTLESAVDAAIAVDTIQHPEDVPYLVLVTGCVDSSETILANTTLTAAQKSLQIGQACAAEAAAAPNAPITAQLVIVAVNAFLQAVTAASTTASTAEFKAHASVPIQQFDPAKLAQIGTRVEVLKAKLPK